MANGYQGNCGKLFLEKHLAIFILFPEVFETFINFPYTVIVCKHYETGVSPIAFLFSFGSEISLGSVFVRISL